MSTPRGVRNNNPGNIRHGDRWQGMAALQSDPDFIQFQGPEWGIRAMARILATYRNSHGLYTIRGIVSRWAPPHENDTTAYVAFVSGRVGLSPDAVLVDADIPLIVQAIIEMENGVQPYTVAQINEGIALA